MFINKSDIEQLKQYSIIDYLSSKGIQPSNTVGNQMVYYSPLTNENTASFLVEPKMNVFNDYSSGQKGDIIRLIQLIEQISFKDAIKRLESLKDSGIENTFSFSGKSNSCKESKIEVKSILPITNPSLIQYVKQRGIDINLGRIYLKEVHFQNKGKNYFAVGFKNSSGYELRNGLGFKGKTANGITVFDKGTLTVNLFEGFFDFLSVLQYYNTNSLNNTTIVLNTNSNLKTFISTLTDNQIINSFLDNDKSGQSTVNQLINKGYNLVNQSKKLYPNSKDFNDYLLGKTIETV
jgi:DNA primase